MSETRFSPLTVYFGLKTLILVLALAVFRPSCRSPVQSRNPTINFHGEKRSNQTHESKSDPEAQLARKGLGKEAKLSYSGNLPVENRHGLIVDSRNRSAAIDVRLMTSFAGIAGSLGCPSAKRW